MLANVNHICFSFVCVYSQVRIIHMESSYVDVHMVTNSRTARPSCDVIKVNCKFVHRYSHNVE